MVEVIHFHSSARKSLVGVKFSKLRSSLHMKKVYGVDNLLA